MKLELKKSSWENLFEVIRNNAINPKGNFWAAIQHLESQLEKPKLFGCKIKADTTLKEGEIELRDECGVKNE